MFPCIFSVRQSQEFITSWEKRAGTGSSGKRVNLKVGCQERGSAKWIYIAFYQLRANLKTNKQINKQKGQEVKLHNPQKKKHSQSYASNHHPTHAAHNAGRAARCSENWAGWSRKLSVVVCIQLSWAEYSVHQNKSHIPAWSSKGECLARLRDVSWVLLAAIAWQERWGGTRKLSDKPSWKQGCQCVRIIDSVSDKSPCSC